jgi:hypothetical protein
VSDGPGEQLWKEGESLRASPGWLIYNQLREQQFTFGLHAANYTQLKASSADLVGDSDERAKQIIELWDARHRERITAVLNETCRLLHNFLASAKMLVDHTRIHARGLYGDHAFMSEYDERVAELAKQPLCRFVQQLRDYNLHYRFPIVQCTMHVENPNAGGIPTNRIIVDLPAVRHWDNWSPEALTYIDSADENPSVADVAEGYMEHILRFYLWMWNREREIWAKELNEVEDRAGKIEALNRQAFPEMFDKDEGS